MSTPWTVTSDTERLALDERRRGRIAVTVTNTGPEPDLAMLEIVTDPAAQSWFTVADPQRSIPGATAAQFQIQAAVPATAAAGQYPVQIRVYSLESIPEETSVLSRPILVDLAGPPAPRPRRRPWWLLIAAVVVLVAVTATVTFVVTRDGGSTPAEGDRSATVVVPAAAGLTTERAVKVFTEAGLAPRVRHRQLPGAAGPPTQSIQPGLVVARGTIVDIVYNVALSAPVITTPVAPFSLLPRIANDPVTGRTGTIASALQVTWTQSEPFVTSWRVLVYQTICALKNGNATLNTDTYSSVDISATVTTPLFATVRYLTPPISLLPRSCGDEFVRVAAVDDFGTAGPFSPARQYGLANR